MIQENCFIITGAMGAGKTSVLNYLRSNNSGGYDFREEPAREILKEQRRINGSGVPEKNPELFCQLMLSRMTDRYIKNIGSEDKVIFDRGIADVIVYAGLFGLDTKVFIRAAEEYRYNKNVFHLQGRREFYATDDERKMDFESAEKFGVILKPVYEELGYSVTDVPLASVEERAGFIMKSIEEILRNK